MKVEIFDKPSGNLRGFAIETMNFTKGKKVVEKRICHAFIYEDKPLDGVTVEAPKSMTLDEMREFAAKITAFAKEIEIQYAIPRGAMTYLQVIEGYERVLKANPGKALKLASGEYAVILDGTLLCASLDAAGVVDPTSIGEFDPRVWDRDAGQWADDESWEQTARVITHPTLVDYRTEPTR